MREPSSPNWAGTGKSKRRKLEVCRRASSRREPSSPNWAGTGKSKRPKLEVCRRASSRRYLSEDVIREILVRLPIKSILRFKSTCQNWYSLIRSRSFIDFHRTRHLEDDDHADELFFSRSHSDRHPYTPKDEPYIISSLYYCSSSGLLKKSTPLFDLKMLRQALAGGKVERPLKKTLVLDESGIFVLGPLSNGISCVIAEEFVENKKLRETYGSCKIAFCNLSTREFHLIRDPFPFTRKGYDIGVRLYSRHFYGFGSIQNQDGVAVDYKVVAIQQEDYHQSCLKAAVYSERRGGWKLIPPKLVGQHQFPKITQNLFFMPVQALLDGSCHWMAKKKQSDGNGQQHCILQFDLANEVFGLIAAPPEDEYFRRPRECSVESHVLVLNDHLAAITVVKLLSNKAVRINHIDVWMMMEYGVAVSWTKIHSYQVDLEGYPLRVLGMSLSTRAADGCSTMIDKIFFEHCPRNTDVLYSCGASGVTSHCIFEHHWACWKPLGLSPYVETLQPVSLDS